MEYFHRCDSPLGWITLAGDAAALTGLWFDGQRYFALGHSDLREGELPVFEEAEWWLAQYFSGREPDFTPPLHLTGTPFQIAVWEALLTIPYGGTMTYGELARALARNGGFPRASARAVGGAVGRNPVSLIVPCHRVVGASGTLTGYAGGLERKQWLLTMEKNAAGAR